MPKSPVEQPDLNSQNQYRKFIVPAAAQQIPKRNEDIANVVKPI